jgi:antitoxin VapB
LVDRAVYPKGLPYDKGMARPAARKGRTLYIKKEKVRREPAPIDRAGIEAISRKIAALPVLDSRTPDEILGYDEFGIPR